MAALRLETNWSLCRSAFLKDEGTILAQGHADLHRCCQRRIYHVVVVMT